MCLFYVVKSNFQWSGIGGISGNVEMFEDVIVPIAFVRDIFTKMMNNCLTIFENTSRTEELQKFAIFGYKYGGTFQTFQVKRKGNIETNFLFIGI